MDKRKGVALIEVIIVLSLLLVIFNLSYIKAQKEVYEVRYYADLLVSQIRSTHQHRRATTDISCKVEIINISSKTQINTYEKNALVNKIVLPENILFTWSKYEGAERGEFSTKVDIRFGHEGIFFNSNSYDVGLTMFITDKNSKKYVKVTIVPTTGRVYSYEYF